MIRSQDRKSLAYREGQRAKVDGLSLQESALKNLKAGTRQHADYLEGFHSHTGTTQILRSA
jgi:hypothetical protein